MKFVFILFFLFFYLSLPAQSMLRVMTYNVENFFDTTDHPTKEDEDFTPEGNRHWTRGRYYKKLQQIAKVITAAGEWETPAIIGLCEVENDSVLSDLTQRTPLRAQEYRYVITQQSDRRGINVALLYQRDKFRYLNHHSFPIQFSRHKHKSTREILHVYGEIVTRDTFDIFVCHFPSKYGGEKESEQDRWDAAATLRKVSDSIIQTRRNPQLLIMGDFNATPDDKSLQDILGAQIHSAVKEEGPFINLIPHSSSPGVNGTHKHQGEWNQLDHLIINKALMDSTSNFRWIPQSSRIFSPPFLISKDKTWRGVRPFRTYYGYKYEGGFSDHLPLIADFYIHLSIKKTNLHEE